MKVTNIPVAKILQQANTRVSIQDHEIQELMGSIGKQGLLQPIGVRPTGKGFECVYGNRRLLAVTKLGWHEIPCVIYDKLENADALFANMAENLQRKNITAAEEGRGYGSFLKEGMTINEIAQRLSVSPARVKAACDVYREVPEKFRDKVFFKISGKQARQSGKIAVSTALKVAALSKSAGLVKQDSEALFEYAKNSGQRKMANVGRLIHAGVPVNQAIKTSEKMIPVEVIFLLPKKVIARVEKLSGRKIHDYIRSVVNSSPLIDLKEIVRGRRRKNGAQLEL